MSRRPQHDPAAAAAAAEAWTAFADGAPPALSSPSAVSAALVLALGYAPPAGEVRAAGCTDDGGICADRAAFAAFVADRLALTDARDRTRDAFDGFDRAGRGFVDLEDALAAFREACPELPEREAVQAFLELDRQGRGRVGLNAYVAVAVPPSSWRRRRSPAGPALTAPLNPPLPPTGSSG